MSWVPELPEFDAGDTIEMGGETIGDVGGGECDLPTPPAMEGDADGDEDSAISGQEGSEGGC